ncbi:lipopolysaccharide-induced tumor necrosis factor-alpha factor homolog [Myxocyprinus asiaticus]|uniref:lipopolysaccharide-induced tumor necrosis factor-alpha factor homolog n=1 Tax=Myxocyprinus asiaticus TaxID=70543 RepID=UPI0022221761|nr:lipopolysaccharide-induced tumor necrosis factor-alpha factor homolog [Myxocyprinus asiaticus]
MASAPPLETTTLVGHPPSYEDTTGTSPNYPPGGPMPYPPVDTKASLPPYPTQADGQMYPAPPQTQPVTTSPVAMQTVYMQSGLGFGAVPVQAYCPVCTQNAVTHLHYISGALAWLSCAGLAIFGCICGCCLIPFCVDSLKDVTHHCPNCNYVLGVHKRI